MWRIENICCYNKYRNGFYLIFTVGIIYNCFGINIIEILLQENYSEEHDDESSLFVQFSFTNLQQSKLSTLQLFIGYAPRCILLLK